MEDEGHICKLKRPSRPWRSPELTSLGTITEILRAGGGKLSPTEGDPGDLRKPSGQA